MRHLRLGRPAEGGDLAPALRQLLRRWCAVRGVMVLRLDVATDDPVGSELAAGTRVLGRAMSKPVDAGAALPPGFGWRPLRPSEFSPWLDAQIHDYAVNGLLRSGGDADAALARARTDFAAVLPAGLGTPDTTLAVLTAADEPVGHLWLAHHRDGSETFGYDLAIAPERRREGWGRAAIALAARLAAAAGDTTLGLHVFGGNDPALTLYEAEGFETRSVSHDLLADG